MSDGGQAPEANKQPAAPETPTRPGKDVLPRAERVKRLLRGEEDPHVALQRAAEAVAIDQTLDKFMGKADSDEKKDLADRGEAAANDYLQFMDKGFGEMSPESKQKILGQVGQVMAHSVGFENYVERTGNDQGVMSGDILGIIHDPAYKDAVKAVWEKNIKRDVFSKDAADLLKTIEETGVPAEVTDNLLRIAKENGIENASSMSAAEITEALKDKQKAQPPEAPQSEAEDDSAPKLQEIDARIRVVDGELGEFNTVVRETDEKGNITERPGKKHEIMKGVYERLAREKGSYDKLQEDYAEALKEMGIEDGNDWNDAVSQAESGDKAIAEGLEYLNLFRQELDSHPYSQAEREGQSLGEEYVGLQEQRQQLAEERAVAAADAEAKKTPEGEYVRSLENVFAEATREWIGSDIVREAEGQAGEDGGEKVLLIDGMAARWGKAIVKDGLVDTSGLNKDNLAQDTFMLATDNLRAVALGIVNPDTGKFYTEYDLEKMTPERIQENFEGKNVEYISTKLLLAQNSPETNQPWTLQEIADQKQSDPDFFKKLQKDTVTGLARNITLLNGKDYMNRIKKAVESSTWGKEVVDDIINSPDFNQEIDRAIETLKTHADTLKSKMSEPGNQPESHMKPVVDKLKWAWKTKKALALGYLLGGPMGAAIVLYMDTKKQKIAAQKEEEAKKQAKEAAHPSEHEDDEKDKEKKKQKTEEEQQAETNRNAAGHRAAAQH